jgi:hypothetical protein
VLTQLRDAVQKTKPHTVLLQLTLFYHRRNNTERERPSHNLLPIIASLGIYTSTLLQQKLFTKYMKYDV